MFKDRNKKYFKQKNSEAISMNLDIVSLQLFCNFVASENKNIHRSNIINLKELIDNLDMSIYENDAEKMSKLTFIKKGIEARLDYNLSKKSMILKHINGGLLSDSIIDLDEINNDEVTWVNKIISDGISFGYMYSSVNELEEICSKFKSSDYTSKSDILDTFKESINRIQNKFRQAEANASSELYFSLEDGKFENCITDVYIKESSPSSRLYTGFVGFNELLGGGYQSQRVYAFLGLPSEGKSITLLDMAIQIKKYNPGYICKDPTKKPAVVYFTLENNQSETIVRLSEMVGIQGSITDYTVEELIQKLRIDGDLRMTDASPMNLIIKYKPGMSVDTSYLFKMYDDLENDGYEVVAVIVDYIKRIKSSSDNSDTRVWLGNVINEFKVFATLKDLVVITASQLNRDATQHIDESRKSNKSDLVRMLGRSQIGESMLILENLDGAFLIAPEWTQEGQKFLGIQRIKKRYKASNLTYLYYPYEGEIKLLEDFNAVEPVYRTTMKEIPTNFDNLNKINRVNDIKDIRDVKLLKPSVGANIFLSGSMSSIDNIVEDADIYDTETAVMNDLITKIS